MNYLLGIDVGTMCTAAAVARLRGGRVEPRAVTLGDRADVAPSVVYLAEDGAVIFGESAEQRAISEPERVVREFIRRIGDPTPIVVGGRTFAAEELSAHAVRWVLNQVTEREGGPPARVAVTHPASWGPHKRELLATTLSGQGVTATFLTEPQAAAQAYAANEHVEPGATFAVYDLGGGTFKAAVVRKDERGFQVLGRPEELERLGGVDFDEAVFEHVRAELSEAFDDLDESDPEVWAAMAHLRRECTQAKETLSAHTEVTIPVQLPGARASVQLSRADFEAMIRSHVEETVTALQRAVTSANLVPEQLTAVLLVGGCSRIPLVAQLVSEQFSRPVTMDSDPIQAIAKGAVLAVSPSVATPGPTVAVPAPRPRPAPPSATATASGYRPVSSGGYGASRSIPPEPSYMTPTSPPQGRPQLPPPTPVATAGVTGTRPAMLVGAGGLLAAAVVIAMLLLIPGRSIGDVTAGLSHALPTAPPSTAAVPETTKPPVPDDSGPVARRTVVVPVQPSPTPTTTVEPTTEPTLEPTTAVSETPTTTVAPTTTATTTTATSGDSGGSDQETS